MSLFYVPHIYLIKFHSFFASDRVGRQELEIVIGDEHISFTTSKIGSLVSFLTRIIYVAHMSYQQACRLS